MTNFQFTADDQAQDLGIRGGRPVAKLDTGYRPRVPVGQRVEFPMNYDYNARIMEPLIQVEEWTDDTSTDSFFGLGAEIDKPRKVVTKKERISIGERDLITFDFLARYRFATANQIARLHGTRLSSTMPRLKKLADHGFVFGREITKTQWIWGVKKKGLERIGMPFKQIPSSAFSFVTQAHTLGLGNLAIELERSGEGSLDVLGLWKKFDLPQPKNRHFRGNWDEPEMGFGEMTISERQIRQAQMTNRNNFRSSELRQLVYEARSNTLKQPELEEGNEHFFVVYGAGGKAREHVPDLVVTRKRGEDNKPLHIAIELELSPKKFAEWREILRSYRDCAPLFDKIVYFTHRRSIAEGLRKVDEEVGLGERLVIRKYGCSDNKTPFWG